MSLTHEIEKLSLYKAHMETMSGMHLGSILDDVKTDTQVKACVKAVIDAQSEAIEVLKRAATLLPWVYLASTVGSGYVGASIVDTNKNPSAIKTAATGIGADIVALIATGGSAALMFPSKNLSGAQAQCDKAKLTISEVRSDIQQLTPEQTIELLAALGVSQDQLDAAIDGASAALGSALGSLALVGTLALTAKIASAVHGYKRSGGLGAIGFFMLGPTGLGMALKQGYGKPLSKVQKKG